MARDFETSQGEILQWVSDTIQVPVQDIELDKPLADMGIDSLDTVHLVSTVEAIIRRELPETVMQGIRTLDDILRIVGQQLALSQKVAPAPVTPPSA
ncbi:MAG: acyl carrier protein [bacterium]|nr:acyl carrier protein [bacterium]